MSTTFDKLEDIFARQELLAAKFRAIEERNNLLEYDYMPVDLQDKHGQARLRSLMWRVVEEAGELLASVRSPAISVASVHEEMADVLHYLVELYLSAGLTADDLVAFTGQDRLDRAFELYPEKDVASDELMLDFIFALTTAGHTLKAKPHKLNPPETSQTVFFYWLVQSFAAFVSLCAALGQDAAGLHSWFLSKEQANLERIRNQA